MIARLSLILCLVSSTALAGSIADYPTANTLGGAEKMVSTQVQGGNNTTVNILPSQVSTYIASHANAWSVAQTFVAPLTINGAAATDRNVVYQTSGSTRWWAEANGTPESGANAGSDYQVCRFTDAGSIVDCPLLITRSSGLVTLTDGAALGAASTATTQSPGDSSTKIATTAFVATSFAPLASPALTGSPTVGGNAIVVTTDSRFSAITQNSQSAGYTMVLSDAGKQLYHPSADTTARTWVIPANGSVAYGVGTKIELLNDCSAGVITLNITTDTLEWFPTGTTGSRSIAACGIATLTKVTSTKWVLTGSGVS